jgi:lysozyme
MLIEQFEGLRLTAYKCPAGVWTIGYGHTEGVKQGDKITIEEANQLLAEDTEKFRNAVDEAVDTHLTPDQMTALTSLCYNIGIRAFTNSTLVKKLNEGDKLAAAMEFPKWSKAGGKRLRGLLRRRMAEAELFLTDS